MDVPECSSHTLASRPMPRAPETPTVALTPTFTRPRALGPQRLLVAVAVADSSGRPG